MKPGVRRHRNAVVIFALILPLVHLVPPVVSRFVAGPRILVEAIFVAIIVSLMTYVFMPIANRLLGGWLQPR